MDRAERDALLRNPTAEAALRHWPYEKVGPPRHPDVPLAGVHRARLRWLEATPQMVAESRAWLKEHGYGEGTGGHAR